MKSQWSLKAKLITAFTVGAMVLAVVGGLSIYYLREVVTTYSWVADVIVPNVEAIGDMDGASRYVTVQVMRVYQANLSDAELAKLEENYKTAVDELLDASKRYEATPFVEGEEALWKPVVSARESFIELARKSLDLSKTHNAQDAQSRDRLIADQFEPARMKYRESLNKSHDFIEKQAKMRGQQASEMASKATAWVGVLVLLGFLFSMSLGIILAHSLSRTIGRIAETLADAAEGTAGASNQLSAASQQLSSGSAEAAASLEETVASLEELSSMVKKNAESAKEAGLLSGKSRDSAELGDVEIQKLITAMSEMGEGAKQIEDIINVIDDIAFQTNLLALNAAVEAARAGDQGKGFAVVAEAVRNLAQRSASAAKDIASLIKQNVEKAENGAQVATSSGSVLKDIVNSVKKVADLNSEIALASQEQSAGITQISQAMNQLDQATQGNASSAEEVASSSEEMSAQAEELRASALELQVIVRGDLRNEAQIRPPKNPEQKSRRAEERAPTVSGKVLPFKPKDLKKENLENLLPLEERNVAGTTKGF